MIIAHIIGGLGNQLLQYAMARRIALKNNATLKLDISDFSTYRLREFKLDRFNIAAEPATPEEIRQFIRNRNRIYLRFIRTWNSLLPFTSRSYVEERFFSYDPETTKLSDNIYLEGYWPSEKYFLDIEQIIRQEFTLKSGMDSYHKDLKKQIEETESTSIHIRRGDYVSNPVTNRAHGTCSLDYYYRAVEMIGRKTKNPHFFIFSDDLTWVQENLKIPYPLTIVNGNDKSDCDDLMLMSACRNHIIANSSYSWWGAWLNPHKDKQVIAPAKWFHGLDYDTKDMLPESWITI